LTSKALWLRAVNSASLNSQRTDGRGSNIAKLEWSAPSQCEQEMKRFYVLFQTYAVISCIAHWVGPEFQGLRSGSGFMYLLGIGGLFWLSKFKTRLEDFLKFGPENL
jgi:hypothetical protein